MCKPWLAKGARLGSLECGFIKARPRGVQALACQGTRLGGWLIQARSMRCLSLMWPVLVMPCETSSCSGCIKDSQEDDFPIYPKKISSEKKLKQQLRDGHKHVGTLGQPSGKFDYIVKYSPPLRIDEPIVPTGWNDGPDDHLRRSPPPLSPPVSPPLLPFPQMVLPQIHMTSLVTYEEKFPSPQTTTKDGSTQQPKVLNLRTVEPDGTTKKLSPAKAVLNWQLENLITQNKVLQKIDNKISLVESKIDQSNIRQIKAQTILERLEAQI
ncbi:hypothetical protein TIFTF001_049887 [Ficus carica]|uniref:Uncharacterized protein n=1 Tax=Ficus carica TaxID=3494 RepID=A0AA88CJX4_FICCA|nr:hypothetical protein TIFTF001_049887 [Ficus carica]